MRLLDCVYCRQANTQARSSEPAMYYSNDLSKSTSKRQLNRFERIGKRGLDLICGLIIAAIFVVVFPFVAVAIKLDSPGDIFYKQERVGLYGAKFTIYKLRSMVQNAERSGQAQWAVKGDSRITKVGNFIRKTRLDELPQVINRPPAKVFDRSSNSNHSSNYLLIIKDWLNIPTGTGSVN
jgi:lipopolysaccharide/colanic/teichoic acid biosynthesis glycosyltransferase